MWIAKFEISRKTSIFEPPAKKNNVTAIGYPLNSFKKDGKYYFSAAGRVFGEENNKKKYIEEIKKDKRVRRLDEKNDFFIVFYERDFPLTQLYNPEFIQLKPITITNKGNEIWEIGCWDKMPLMDLIRFVKKQKIMFKLLKLKQEKIDNLAVVNVIPNLTKKQKAALELAVDKGYYEYPKKVELKVLARQMGISYSTFQAHLRKAEGKIIPYMARNI